MDWSNIDIDLIQLVRKHRFNFESVANAIKTTENLGHPDFCENLDKKMVRIQYAKLKKEQNLSSNSQKKQDKVIEAYNLAKVEEKKVFFSKLITSMSSIDLRNFVDL